MQLCSTSPVKKNSSPSEYSKHTSVKSIRVIADFIQQTFRECALHVMHCAVLRTTETQFPVLQKRNSTGDSDKQLANCLFGFS